MRWTTTNGTGDRRCMEGKDLNNFLSIIITIQEGDRMAEDFDYRDKEHAQLADAVLEVKKAVVEMGMRNEQVLGKKIDELKEVHISGNEKIYKILVEIRDALKR